MHNGPRLACGISRSHLGLAKSNAPFAKSNWRANLQRRTVSVSQSMSGSTKSAFIIVSGSGSLILTSL